MFRSLRLRNFRIYFLGGLVANTGTWIQRVAQDWLVLQLTDNSPIALGVTTAVQFTPMIVLGLFSGAIADRISKRALLAMATTFHLLVSTTLGVLVLTETVQVWHVVALALLFGVGSSLEIPTRQAFISELVGKEVLPNAVSLNSASFNVARVVGPALGGLLIGLVFASTGPLFLVHAGSMLATVGSLALLRRDQLHSLVPIDQRTTRIREVFSELRGRADLQLVLVIVAVSGIFALNYQMLIALITTAEFGMDAAGFGAMSSLMAVGAIAGALSSARRARASLRLLVLASTAFGALIMLNAWMPTVPLFGASLVVLGYASLTVLTTATSLMQLSARPALRGRVMGLFVVVMFAGIPLGGPAIGALAELLGIRAAVGLGGLTCAIVSVVGAAITLSRMGTSFRELRTYIVPRRRRQLPPMG